MARLTSCHPEGNKEAMDVGGVGAEHPAQRVQEPSDDGGPAAATRVDEQADERSCRGTLTNEVTNGVVLSCFLSKSSQEDED